MSFKLSGNYKQTGAKKFRKKNKNSRFLQNAKGFAKQGIFGRGSRINDDHYSYFINILDTMKKGFDDVEEKVNMANNVFEQTKGDEVLLASNQIVSKVLESLLGFIDAEHLELYFKIFGDNFRPLCSDRFASHVLQKMVEIAFLRFVSKDTLKRDFSETKDTKKINDEGGPPLAKKTKLNEGNFSEETYNLETEFTQEHKTKCGNFVLRIGKFMLNNLENFVWDTCASHIMRTSILCLSGIHKAKLAFEKKDSVLANNKVYEVPSEWHDVCKEFVERLEMWPQFSDLPYREHSSALLSILCTALNVIDRKMLKNFGNKILTEGILKNSTVEKEKMHEIETISDEGSSKEEHEQRKGSTMENEPKLPTGLKFRTSIHLLETLLIVADQELFNKLYTMLFANKLALLAKTPITHFAVKKLVQNAPKKDIFENIFKELENHIEELLRIGHTNIIYSLSSTCLRLKSKQAQFIAALKSALHISGDKEHMKYFFLCLLKLKPFEVTKNDNSTIVHLHGSYLIQDILRFNKPIFFVNCILETSPNYLMTVFSTPNGSYICDAFLQSEFIGEKSRDKLLKLLEGFYVDLAITKYGSYVIESCFASAQDAQKAKIVKELSENLNKLKGSYFGQIISDKLRVDTYRLSAEQWKASIERKESKAQQLFKDIIN